MWFSKKYRLTDTKAFSNGSTDWHCHVLPSVDDGISTMDDALEVLAHHESVGISEMWLTPHIMEDVPNKTDALRRRFDELQEAYAKAAKEGVVDDVECKGTIKLHLAAENMIDNLFNERLAAKDLLPIGEKGNHLLVETSYMQPPLKLWETLQAILDAGFFPVLAHPERYRYMDDDDYERLLSMQVKLQMNMTSLLGVYGRMAQDKALWLLSEGSYTLMGSDLHSLGHFAHAIDKKELKKSVVAQIAEIPNSLK